MPFVSCLVFFVIIFISIVDSSDTFFTGIIACCMLIIVNRTLSVPWHVTVVVGLSLLSN